MENDGFFTEDELKGEFAAVDELENEATEPEVKPKPVQPVDTSNEDSIPVKYRGKSVEDIIKMHQESEKLINKHSEEVGFARRMAEAAAKRLESDNGSRERTDVDQVNPDVEFFADPQKAVADAIANNPTVREAQETIRNQREEAALRRVTEAVGDPKAIVSDPEFATWLQENPFRIQALKHANINADADAAIEILGNFKRQKTEKENANKSTKEALTNQNNSSKKAAMVDSGNSGEKVTGKIYRRADLIRLQNTDPDRYDRLEAEVMKAYAEGRVV